jgi:hypothetical protein
MRIPKEGAGVYYFVQPVSLWSTMIYAVPAFPAGFAAGGFCGQEKTVSAGVGMK